MKESKFELSYLLNNDALYGEEKANTVLSLMSPKFNSLNNYSYWLLLYALSDTLKIFQLTQLAVLQNSVIMAILYIRKLTLKNLSTFSKVSVWELVEPRSVWLENWILNFPRVAFVSIWILIIAPYWGQFLVYSIFLIHMHYLNKYM